jgi:hypothetical protein
VVLLGTVPAAAGWPSALIVIAGEVDLLAAARAELVALGVVPV